MISILLVTAFSVFSAPDHSLSTIKSELAQAKAQVNNVRDAKTKKVLMGKLQNTYGPSLVARAERTMLRMHQEISNLNQTIKTQEANKVYEMKRDVRIAAHLKRINALQARLVVLQSIGNGIVNIHKTLNFSLRPSQSALQLFSFDLNRGRKKLSRGVTTLENRTINLLTDAKLVTKSKTGLEARFQKVKPRVSGPQNTGRLPANIGATAPRFGGLN